MTKQGMAYLTEYLAEHGYVCFVSDPRDGRAKLVQLTVRGKSVQETLIALGREVEADLADRMGGKRMEQLRHLLERLGRTLAHTGIGEE
jgi:DNA-binding MarR family transcriptional regulator